MVFPSRQFTYTEPDPRNQHPNVWYYVPSSDDWVRKLGASAAVSTSPPVTPPPYDPPNLIDDDAPAASPYYAEAGGQWVPGPATGYGGGSRVLPPAPVGNTTMSTATWTFNTVPSGWCEVQATWPGSPDPVNQPWSTAAQYSYSLDSGATWHYYPQDNAPVTVNQNVPDPRTQATDGSNWYAIMTVYLPPPPPGSTTPQLQVRLTGQPAAGGYVVADAVRLVTVQNNVQITSLTRSFDGKTAAATVTVTPYVPRP